MVRMHTLCPTATPAIATAVAPLSTPVPSRATVGLTFALLISVCAVSDPQLINSRQSTVANVDKHL